MEERAKQAATLAKQGQALASDMEWFTVNDKKYMKMKLLGRGGFSKVYKVFDSKEQREVALKIIDCEDADKVVINSYDNEVEILKKLKNCHNIIKLIDSRVEKTKRYLLLECGETDLRRASAKPLRAFNKNSFFFFWKSFICVHKRTHFPGTKNQF